MFAIGLEHKYMKSNSPNVLFFRFSCADIPIHHHPTKEESFILLIVEVLVTTYNDDGTVMKRGFRPS